MCRIYGFFNAKATPHELRAVAALQHHGGPDGRGTARSGGWGIGNNRLAIVDLDGGAQPYELGERIKVVFNGEIYNHVRLRAELTAKGYRFDDHCDGNVLPALYHAYGDAFVDHLDGMYAIAVVDLRGAEPRLLLATDHIGMKPLYYRWDAAARSLHFSSELPALLGFGEVAPAEWEGGLDAYLATKTPFGEQTMFDGVKVMPPSTTMVCTEYSGLHTYRRRPPVAEVLPEDDAAVASDLQERLRYEVGQLLVADVPVATITSGGLDSSLVTALAAESATELHTFNIAYTGNWPADERRFARQVSDRAGTTYHQVEIDPATFPDLLADVVWHLGQPNADPITLSTYALFNAVRDSGFKVALTGDAADEVFGGYSRMTAATRASLDDKPWYDKYLDALGVLPAAARHELYTDDYRAALADGGPAIPAEATARLATGEGSVLERITEFELGHRLPAYHLRRVDHLSMSGSVEVRLPFCQRSVVSLGRALSDRRRIDGTGVKRTLYAAAAGLLPDEVLNRPKQPFTLPITAMLTPGWPLWEYARDLLAGSRLKAAGQVDASAVDRLFAQQATEPEDTTALTIWALAVHEIWREQFFGAKRGR
ncbi:asparagine synthase (glutamine-hydrolyzing) [Amycolatopsis sp. 195334CR]|uniref:asparagine synthase (glutamine-hydrolyzing) n=1 Tax=Amycolatopsis sp. 195334CR TaxID=2814588 RepID=UPI001A8EF439|nr:asparagine synthase (glutamine-hydrolyzing) [Amycolatopsis sp. 195334CR]MBN6036947.1 asparagine synthase (glutamine-hydrolyzing) [Amycolatopsis sp. 195334CR]